MKWELPISPFDDTEDHWSFCILILVLYPREHRQFHLNWQNYVNVFQKQHKLLLQAVRGMSVYGYSMYNHIQYVCKYISLCQKRLLVKVLTSLVFLRHDKTDVVTYHDSSSVCYMWSWASNHKICNKLTFHFLRCQSFPPLLTLVTAVKKTIPPQGPFINCCWAFDHIIFIEIRCCLIFHFLWVL